MDFSDPRPWTGPFPTEWVSDYSLLLHVQYCIEISVFNANSVEPDQTPHSAAPDLVLHCLPMSLLWDARHTWVKVQIVNFGTCLTGVPLNCSN